ncbi:unnamed protein product, partial [Cuscuta epithymum]
MSTFIRSIIYHQENTIIKVIWFSCLRCIHNNSSPALRTLWFIGCMTRILHLQQATKKELQKETMFLGVNLFDRFLTKGYFRKENNLQIAGIACLTLATRIEENQPLNCIRNKTFDIGMKVYSRSEVVAMEWVVQEVLNFQCFLPTIYNFLWFYLKAARASEMVEKTVKYLALVTLLGHEHLNYWPSTVAAGLVILTLSSMGLHASCNLVTQSHSRTKDRDLPKCIKSLKCLGCYNKIQH